MGNTKNNTKSVLALTVSDALTKYSKTKTKSNSALDSVTNSALEQGMLHTDWISPKSAFSTCTPEMWSDMRRTVILSFPIGIQNMLVTDTKKLKRTEVASEKKTEKTTANKRYWQQQIGAKINDVKSAIKKATGAVDEQPENTKTLLDSINEHLAKIRIMVSEADEKAVEKLPESIRNYFLPSAE